MSRILRGVAASPGVAMAEPWLYVPAAGGSDSLPLDECASTVATDLARLAERLRSLGRDSEAGILDAQALMAQDPELLGAARRLVAAGSGDSEAILAAGEEQAALLEGLDDELIAARAADVRDVAERIARVIRGQQLVPPERRCIAVAADLPPSVTAELDPKLLAGIALEGGSPTAHAAILARGLGIPAVVGVSDLLKEVAGCESLGIDGSSGEVTLEPDPSARQRLEAAIGAWHEQAATDALLSDRPLATRDGFRVMLGANIGGPDEAAAAVEAGAEGVGLFRTEFMFMGRPTAPTQSEQAEAYATALHSFGERPVVIRLLDVGGDKRLPYLEQPPEENPFLGVRAIRLAARNRELLVTQVRAILDAASRVGTRAWIMAPMVADADDVALVRSLVAEAAGDFAAGDPRVGIMVELPAAAVLADQLAARVDFFSIGTNDLTQYLLAVDRSNPALAERQDPMHPAVLRSIRSVVAGARAHEIPVAVCGEMAGDPVGAVVLVGLGVDELSMDPRSFGKVKRALAAWTRDEAAAVATRACDATSAAEARALVPAR
jgi:phosphoenolpyruvate-protein phosphotransferase